MDIRIVPPCVEAKLPGYAFPSRSLGTRWKRRTCPLLPQRHLRLYHKLRRCYSLARSDRIAAGAAQFPVGGSQALRMD